MNSNEEQKKSLVNNLDPFYVIDPKVQQLQTQERKKPIILFANSKSYTTQEVIQKLEALNPRGDTGDGDDQRIFLEFQIFDSEILGGTKICNIFLESLI